MYVSPTEKHRTLDQHDKFVNLDQERYGKFEIGTRVSRVRMSYVQYLEQHRGVLVRLSQ
jgi:hypothetical protein